MTVADYIKELEKLPQDLEVFEFAIRGTIFELHDASAPMVRKFTSNRVNFVNRIDKNAMLHKEVVIL